MTNTTEELAKEILDHEANFLGWHCPTCEGVDEEEMATVVVGARIWHPMRIVTFLQQENPEQAEAYVREHSLFAKQDTK